MANELTQVVPPDPHIGSPLYLTSIQNGDPIENISFRNEEVGTIGFSLVKSGLFPIHSIFSSVVTIEDDPRYRIEGLVYSLENDHLVLRWFPFDNNSVDGQGNPVPWVKTLKLYGVSNKRAEKIESWVSFQNSYKTPFKLLVGERLDIFFKAFDQNNLPLYVMSNSRTFFVENRSVIRDLNAFWQYYPQTPYGFPSDVYPQITDNLNLEAVIQEGDIFLTWDSIFFADYSIARYKIEYTVNDGSLQTIVLEEPDSVSYNLGKVFQQHPSKLKVQVSLEYRQYTTNNFYWVRLANSRLEVHQEKELVDILTQGSYYLPTPPDVLRLVHTTLQDGESNIIREVNSLLYHLAKGVEKLKSKNSLIQELSVLPLRFYEKMSELNNPQLIRAANAIKGVPEYVTQVIKEPGINLSIVSTKPYIIQIEDPIPPSFDPIKYADKLIDTLPVSVSPIIIQNAEIPCTFTLDKKVNPADGALGVWSDCLGFKYEERVIIWIVHNSDYEVFVDIGDAYMGVDSERTIYSFVPWVPTWDENFILSEVDPIGQVIVIQTRLNSDEIQAFTDYAVKNTNIKTRRFHLDLSWSGLLNGEALTPTKRAGERFGFTGRACVVDTNKSKISGGLKFSERYVDEVQLLADDQYHFDVYAVDIPVPEDSEAVLQQSDKTTEVPVIDEETTDCILTNIQPAISAKLPAMWFGKWGPGSWIDTDYSIILDGIKQTSETISVIDQVEVVQSTSVNFYQTEHPV